MSPGMIAFVNTVVNSAAAVAATKATSTSRIVAMDAPGTASHSAERLAMNRSEKSAIQGFLAPRPSASAPRSGLPMAISTPAAAAAYPQSAWPRAGSPTTAFAK